MNAKSKNRVLAVGKYSKGQFEIKTLGEDGKIKTIEFAKSNVSTTETNENTKKTEEKPSEILTAYNVRKPKLPVQESIDVPDFMKKRSTKMQRERLRKDLGFLGAMLHNLNLNNEW